MLLFLRNILPTIGFAALCAATVPAHAQYPFDVPYVPTPQVVVDEMLRLAAVGPRDFVVDLGSGDGRIVITAAQKFGAHGLGVDLDAQLISQSEENARLAGVEERVKFLNQDLFKTDLSQATVVTMYLVPSVNRRVRPRLLELKPGTRIVSHDFDLDDWLPDQKTTIRKNVFLWIVPARVDGHWQAHIALPDGTRSFEFEFKQRFQEFDGLVRVDKQIAQLWEPKMQGERVRFIVVDNADREKEASLYFEGRVSGDVMEGDITRGVGDARTRIAWRAVRVAP